jgi:CubicO group peptidase (beta-lactamase class C family)
VRADEKKIDRSAIDSILKDARNQWNAPGLAVAIVLGDDVYLKGMGVREIGKTDPVTPDTVFALASLTKAFAATSLGILVDEGKATWDDPVRKHLDWFRLHDPLADKEVTLRDLLCHRTGLARHDQLIFRAPWSLEESVRRMAHLELTHSFRSRFEYNNLAYVAAGMATGKAAGMPWEEFVRKRILSPLGMKNAVFTDVQARERADHATPHRRGKAGKQSAIAWYPDAKQVRASGSLKAGARDLAAWLQLQLGHGVYAGKRIISAESLTETHTPQIVVPQNPALSRLTETTQTSYGLGWFIRDYRGWHTINHGGANEGFRGRIVLVPRAKLGIALLTNAEEMDMLEATSYRMIDRILGLKERDWFGMARKAVDSKAKGTALARKQGTKPSRELSAYAGKYHDRAYGDLVIQSTDRGLVVSWSSFRLPLEHFHYDTFQLKTDSDDTRPMKNELLTFALNRDANVTQVRFVGRIFTRMGK